MSSVGQTVQILDSCFISRHLTQEIISLCTFSIEQQCSCIIDPPYFIPKHSFPIQSITGQNIGKTRWVGCPKETPQTIVTNITETILKQTLHDIQFVDDAWIYYIQTDPQQLLRLTEYTDTWINQWNWTSYIDHQKWHCCEFQNTNLISVGSLDVFPHSMQFMHLQSISFLNMGTQISLNLNGCPQLQQLRIDSAHSLREVFMSHCSKIKYINVQRCSLLHSVDLSNQVDLEYLRLDGASISFIDVRHCTQLYHLDLDGTYIKQLLLHNLDKLVALYCSCRHLKDLCLIGCTSLCYVQCLCNIKKINARNLDSLKNIFVCKRTKVVNVHDNTNVHNQLW